MAWEVLKIVLGGIAGLIIGLLILWWVFGRDPLGIAKRIPPPFNVVVPPRLRGPQPHPKAQRVRRNPQPSHVALLRFNIGSLVLVLPAAQLVGARSGRRHASEVRNNQRQLPQSRHSGSRA